MTQNDIIAGEKFATFSNQDNVTTPLAFSMAPEDGKIENGCDDAALAG